MGKDHHTHDKERKQDQEADYKKQPQPEDENQHHKDNKHHQIPTVHKELIYKRQHALDILIEKINAIKQQDRTQGQ